MSTVKVVAAVIQNRSGQILIAKRLDHLHQGGLWEFPGGKIESGESARQALSRELEEELGIRMVSGKPLLKVTHDYGEKVVELDFWCVDDFGGIARGCEGQRICWVKPSELSSYPFPKANQPIVQHLIGRHV